MLLRDSRRALRSRRCWKILRDTQNVPVVRDWEYFGGCLVEESRHGVEHSSRWPGIRKDSELEHLVVVSAGLEILVFLRADRSTHPPSRGELELEEEEAPAEIRVRVERKICLIQRAWCEPCEVAWMPLVRDLGAEVGFEEPL